MRFYFPIFFGLVSLLAAGSVSARDFIIGGQDVGPRDPIQASTVGLFEPSASGRGGSLCTASLISKDIALTAAHCIQPGAPKPVLIFGRDLHSPNAVRRPVQAVAVHPKWGASAGQGMDQGDIALVKFPNGIPQGYRKVSTVPTDADIKPGTTAILAGYGISDAHTHEGAGRLRKTEVSVLQSRPGKTEMILDQSHGRGACHGDSGGPAFIRKRGRMVLAGITNRGYPNHAPDDCGHQVVYTKVPAYRSWIQKNERKLEATKSKPYARRLNLPKKPVKRDQSRVRAKRPLGRAKHRRARR